MKKFIKKVILLFFVFCLSSIAYSQTPTNAFYDVIQANGNGIRFWGGNASWKIAMGTSSDYVLGPVSNASIKMTSSNLNVGNGWTWGVVGQTPIAALNYQGKFQISSNFIYDATTSRMGIGTITPTCAVDVFGSIRSFYTDTYGTAYVSLNTNDPTEPNISFENLYGQKAELALNLGGQISVSNPVNSTNFVVENSSSFPKCSFTLGNLTTGYQWYYDNTSDANTLTLKSINGNSVYDLMSVNPIDGFKIPYLTTDRIIFSGGVNSIEMNGTNHGSLNKVGVSYFTEPTVGNGWRWMTTDGNVISSIGVDGLYTSKRIKLVNTGSTSTVFESNAGYVGTTYGTSGLFKGGYFEVQGASAAKGLKIYPSGNICIGNDYDITDVKLYVDAPNSPVGMIINGKMQDGTGLSIQGMSSGVGISVGNTAGSAIHANTFVGKAIYATATTSSSTAIYAEAATSYYGYGTSGLFLGGNFKIQRTAQSTLPDFMVNIDGNVMIGTATPYGGATPYKLSVKGKIACQELKVDIAPASWPDYVFSDSYKLRSIKELESYINENKHLPEVATAQEIEQNGVSVGEMQTKMMQKIEELTLYIIQQQKMMEKQQATIETLQEEVATLKK